MKQKESASILQHGQQKKGKEMDCRIWGDTSKNKEGKVLRISFQNINGFGYGQDEFKAEDIRRLIQEREIDICLLAEMNVNWRVLNKRRTINDRVRGWFENQCVSTAYNHHDRTCNQYQPGGVAIITQGDMSLRKQRTGQDPRLMGRWAWQLFRGKNNIKIRVISVYYASEVKEFGRKKAYTQQQRAILKMKRKESVVELFWKDLFQEIDKWLDAGEQLIIGGDWNTDVRNKKFLKEFEDRQIVPAITGKHGINGPETYARGSKPIDEILISSTLGLKRAGYMERGAAL